jgi:plasmid stabilization system protein ParE
MALKIFWSKRASIKFEQIVGYLLNEWSENSAKEFISKVFDFLDILPDYPEIGSLENKEKNIRGFTIVQQVTLYYRIKKDSIVLIVFFNNRQNPEKKKL